MSAPTIRALEDADYESLPSCLNAAFSGYRDATRYQLPMLAFFREWMWAEGPWLLRAYRHFHFSWGRARMQEPSGKNPDS